MQADFGLGLTLGPWFDIILLEIIMVDSHKIPLNEIYYGDVYRATSIVDYQGMGVPPQYYGDLVKQDVIMVKFENKYVPVSLIPDLWTYNNYAQNENNPTFKNSYLSQKPEKIYGLFLKDEPKHLFPWQSGGVTIDQARKLIREDEQK